MSKFSLSPSRQAKIIVGTTALYLALATFLSYIGSGGALVFLFCIIPYIFSLWVLTFTAPISGRAGFTVGATIVLACFGTIIISSKDPKAGQLWWFYLFSIPIAAIGAGLVSNYLVKWLSIRAELASSVIGTIVLGLFPYAFIAFSA